MNIINDVRGESLFFAIYLFYIKQVQWQIFLKIEFVKIFVKLVLISWMPFTQSVGFVFDPNACLLYFEAGEFYYVSTFLIKLQAVLKEWKKMTRFLWNWTLSLPIYLLSLWLSMTTTPNLKTLHAIYLDSNLNILIKDSIFFRPILSTPFPGSKIVFIFNTVFSFPLCDLLLDADNDLYLNKKKMICAKFRWYIYYISCFDEDGNVKSSNVYQHLTRKAWA